MAKTSRSPRLFLQRSGLAETYRKPLPTIDLAALPARTYRDGEGQPPFVLQQGLQGDPPPDRAKTGEWPYRPS